MKIQLVKKFHVDMQPEYLLIFIKAHHWVISWVSFIHFTSSQRKISDYHHHHHHQLAMSLMTGIHCRTGADHVCTSHFSKIHFIIMSPTFRFVVNE
jgi:hypothetical protein